jgi:hypothetical protein
MSDKPTVFRDLPADSYPFLVEFYNDEGRLVHHIEVTGPGAIEIPGLSDEHGPIHVQTTYPDGRRVVMLADGMTRDTTKKKFSLGGYLAGRAAGARAVIIPRDDWTTAPPGYYDEDE